MKHALSVALLLVPTLAAAKGGPPKLQPKQLAAATVLRTRFGPARVMKGAVLLYNRDDDPVRVTPLTDDSLLARGVLDGAQTVLGFALPDGTDVTFFEPYDDDGALIELRRPTRFGQALFTGRVRLEATDDDARVSGTLAEEVVVEGVPLAAGKPAGVVGPAASLQRGVEPALLAFGVVARDHELRRGDRVVPLRRGDEVSMLARRLGGNARDGDRLHVRFADPTSERLLDGRWPTSHDADYWPGGALREVRADREVPVHAFAAAAGTSITFWEDGTPKMIHTARAARAHGYLLSGEGDEVAFWPNGNVLCAGAAESEVFFREPPVRARGERRSYATVYFAPDGSPRLLAVSDPHEQGDRRFEITPGARLRFREILAGHPLHEKFYRGCRDPADPFRARLVGWLREGGAGPAPPRPLGPFPRAVSSVGRRPTFRWQLAPGTDGAHLELCLDSDCREVLSRHDVAGATFSTRLPRAAAYWRLFGRAGAAVGAVESPIWRLRGGEDVNGNGLADVVAGGGRRLLFGWFGNSPPEPPAIDLGTSGVLALVGDVDGDGRSDLVHGDPACAGPIKDRAACGVGRVHLYLRPDKKKTTTLVQPARAADTSFGTWIVGAGDLDGDGHGDVGIVDARGAYLYRGGPAGLAPAPVLTIPPPVQELVPAGDIDGDGHDDLIAVGGRAPRLVLGAAAGPRLARDLPADHDVAAAGDFNGDGFTDVALGRVEKGTLIILDGGPAGLAARPSATFTIRAHPDRLYPVPLRGVGDLDGDGADELIAIDSCAHLDRGSCSAVRAYVYRGGPRGLTAAGHLDPKRTIMWITGSELTPIGRLDGDAYADFMLAGNLYRGGRFDFGHELVPTSHPAVK